MGRRASSRGALVLLSVVGVALGVGVSGAQAATTTCTYDLSGCEAPLQQVLAGAQPTDGSTLPDVNGLVQGGDGASIEDFYAAQVDAQVAPDAAVAESGLAVDGSLGALDVGAGLLAPETLGVSVVGAVAISYGVKVLWGTFVQPSDAPTAALEPAGAVGGPTWVHFANGLCGQGPGWELEWSSLQLNGSYPDNLWTGTDTADGVHVPRGGWSSGVPCGYPNADDLAAAGLITAGSQPYVDLKAIWESLSQDTGTGCDGGPSWMQTYDGPETSGPYGVAPNGPNVAWRMLYLTDAQFTQMFECELEEYEPSPSSPPATTTITAPVPASIDFGAARSDVSRDPNVVSLVNTQLAASGATVTQSAGSNTGLWSYNGTDTVTYGPYTVPSGDDDVRIYCDDPNSDTTWTSVSPGQSVTITRQGIGGLSAGDALNCYLDAAPDTTNGSQTQTADPAVQPNPVALQYGTEVTPQTTTPDGTTGNGPSCDTPSVGSIDFGPLQHLQIANVFPFGVFTWLSNGIGGWSSSASAPSFDIPLLGYGVGHPVHVDLSVLDPEMPTIRGLFLILFTVLAIYFLASGALGFGGGGGGAE